MTFDQFVDVICKKPESPTFRRAIDWVSSNCISRDNRLTFFQLFDSVVDNCEQEAGVMSYEELNRPDAEMPEKKRIIVFDEKDFSFFIIIYTAKKEYIRCFADEQPINQVNQILRLVADKMAENEFFAQGIDLKNFNQFLIFIFKYLFIFFKFKSAERNQWLDSQMDLCSFSIRVHEILSTACDLESNRYSAKCKRSGYVEKETKHFYFGRNSSQPYGNVLGEQRRQNHGL